MYVVLGEHTLEGTPGWKLLENVSILPIFSLRKENVHSKYFYLKDGVTGFWPNLALACWNAVIGNKT